MGNGVGVESKRKGGFTSDFNQLEKLCKNGYFFENHDEYVMRAQQAIQWDSIDCLELLITSGNVRKLQPLHQAAKLGKLESVEILLSAGFSGDGTDKDGRTPLHLCCLVHSEEAALCACLLALWYPKSVDRYDRAGFVPLHLAAINDNTIVANAIIKVSTTSLSKRTTKGKDVYELAKENNCLEMVKWYHQQQQSTSSKSSKSKRNHESKQQEEVSTEKIMEIWEKFFENAFKRAGVEYDDLDDSLPPAPVTTTTTTRTVSSKSKTQTKTSPSSSSKSIKNTAKKKSSKATHPDDLWSYYANQSDEEEDYYDEPAEAKADAHYNYNYGYGYDYDSTSDVYIAQERLDWFDWLVYYDDTLQAYGIVHYTHPSQSSNTQWLVDFVEELRTSNAYLFLQVNESEVATWSYPSNLIELIHSGWMMYYDLTSNMCSWLNVLTYQCETYLPIGLSESSDVLYQYYRFQPYYRQAGEEEEVGRSEKRRTEGKEDGWYEDNNDWIATEWMMAEQEVTKAWVMVIMQSSLSEEEGSNEKHQAKLEADDQPQQHHYYLHLWTKQTCWDAPIGWDELVLNEWQGWWCCCMETDPGNLFWYDPESGTSNWIEF